jgi:sulfate transport system substrate-binding protein
VQVIFPNPKTSGNARYTYLAATAYAKEAFNGDEAKVRGFVTKLFDNVPVFDTGGRGSTTTFAERELGDVLITFESETQGIAREYGTDKYEQVVPSSTRSSTHMAAAISPRPTSTSSIRRKARRSRQRTACASATRRSPRSSRTSSPTCGW